MGVPPQGFIFTSSENPLLHSFFWHGGTSIWLSTSVETDRVVQVDINVDIDAPNNLHARTFYLKAEMISASPYGRLCHWEDLRALVSLGRFAGARVIGKICGSSCQSLGKFAGARVSRWEDLRDLVSVVGKICGSSCQSLGRFAGARVNRWEDLLDSCRGKTCGTHVAGRFAGAPDECH